MFEKIYSAGQVKVSRQCEQWLKDCAAKLVGEISELNLAIRVLYARIRWMNSCRIESRIVVAEVATERAVECRAHLADGLSPYSRSWMTRTLGRPMLSRLQLRYLSSRHVHLISA